MNSLKSIPSHVFLFILLCWFLGNGGSQLARAQITDTIKPGEVLGYSQMLVSADGRFQLGFFNTSAPDGGYLGIWYVNDVYNSKVWVGNRDTPVLGGKGNLTMDVEGQLKIVHDGGSPVPLNADKATPISIATLENSGNFRVKELNSDGSTKRVLWQSFDYPTDTLLPGMKLGMDFKTQQKWMLTSWVTYQIPAAGGFSLEWNSTANEARQLIMRLRGDMYWVGTTSKFEEAASLGFDGQFYNFSYVFNENESYFSYSVPDGQISRWVLTSDGSLTDNPKPIIVTSGKCFGYSSDAGCVKPEAISCRNHNQKFEKRRGYFIPSQPGSPSQPDIDDNSSISIGDCWARCWNTCSCVGFSTFPNNETGCRFYHGKFVQDAVGNLEQLYVQIVTGSNRAKKWWIGIIAATIAALVGILGLICFLRRKKLHRNEENNEEAELLAMIASGEDQEANEISIGGKKDHDLKVFSFPYIEVATNNFSVENKLGQGGFGPVYKGKLPGGQEIAVKRLSMSSGQGLVEFKNELLLIAKLQHMNLVRLLGCSVKGDEKILIYEYMPNKSLDVFLFDPKRKELLNWELRYNIIEGIAQGLLYLHRYSRLRIIHRDLKASNILLDKDMNPKISDFGMARVFGRNDTEANTNRVVGTYGYMSPEYAMNGNFSEKSDVYSFGVLLLEIVSGQKNNGFYHPEHPMNLVGYAWELWKEGRSSEIMDLTLVESNSTVQILRCIHVSLLCVEEFAADRPTMSSVISMLKNEMLPLPTPKQIAFSTERKVMETNLPNREQEISLASGTISEMSPR